MSGDTIEEASSFAGEILCLPESVEAVRDFESGEMLEKMEKGFVLPMKKGRLMLEVKEFFAV